MQQFRWKCFPSGSRDCGICLQHTSQAEAQHSYVMWPKKLFNFFEGPVGGVETSSHLAENNG